MEGRTRAISAMTTGAIESYRKGAALLDKEVARDLNARDLQEQLLLAHTNIGRRFSSGGETLKTRFRPLRKRPRKPRRSTPETSDFLPCPAVVAGVYGPGLGPGAWRAARRGLCRHFRRGWSLHENRSRSADGGSRSTLRRRPGQVSLASRHFGVGYALVALGDRTGGDSYYRQALDIQLEGDRDYRRRMLAASNSEHPHHRELADDL